MIRKLLRWLGGAQQVRLVVRVGFRTALIGVQHGEGEARWLKEIHNVHAAPMDIVLRDVALLPEGTDRD